MANQYLLLSVAQKVAAVTLHRPDKRNALAPEVLEEITSPRKRGQVLQYSIHFPLTARRSIQICSFTMSSR